MENKMELTFPANSKNESFARVCAGAFMSQLDPTLEEMQDVKTAVSEAVTNAVVHAYPQEEGNITLRALLRGTSFVIEVEDYGIGIEDVEKAKQAFYTTKEGEERSGMGFTVMALLMDSVDVKSEPGRGTRVILQKLVRKK